MMPAFPASFIFTGLNPGFTNVHLYKLEAVKCRTLSICGTAGQEISAASLLGHPFTGITKRSHEYKNDTKWHLLWPQLPHKISTQMTNTHVEQMHRGNGNCLFDLLCFFSWLFSELFYFMLSEDNYLSSWWRINMWRNFQPYTHESSIPAACNLPLTWECLETSSRASS